jgi:hypothetical protein
MVSEMVSDLTGSDKQVAWASSIRAKFLDGIDAVEQLAHDKLASTPDSNYNRRFQLALDFILLAKSQQDAGWWITNRVIGVESITTNKFGATALDKLNIIASHAVQLAADK